MAHAPGDRLGELLGRRRLEAARSADEAAQVAIAGADVVVREAPAVAQPALVDLGVVAREHAPHAVLAHGAPGVAADGALPAHARDVVDLPGPRVEAVHGRGERADRAELDHVAGEATAVGLLLERRDDRARAALARDQLLVLGDVLREAGAAVAEDAALAVERDQRRDRERLLVGALVEVEARVAGPVAVGQVLQRALAALVADGAVERVVEEDELEHRLLALGRALRARVHLHAVGGGHRAGRLQLRHALDLDQAHAAGADRGPEPRLVAEHRDLDPGVRRREHERRALRHGQLAPVDLERHGRHVGRAHDGETVSRGSRLRGCG